ncbi:MAG: 50S ribosomal protein L21 [Mycoplasmataceae bacterium]|jgi:large subunit ribosomal protein L21|nr:50S ribosomal protein L21 [Mycoplasmataceae bacterium]
MFAIFETGGKQYKVKQNDEIYVEKIIANVGDAVRFEKILMCDEKVGNPYISGAYVICEVVKHGKQNKILIIKHLPQRHHTKHQGHRQPYTKLVVKEIIG